MNNNDYPLVSVIIPAYNAEKFIGKTLDSVIKQTYQNIEIIVIDDGSQDQTVSIVKLFIHQDKRIKLLSQQNLGVAAARNKGIKVAQGEFIAPIDADDLWYPQNLEKQVQLIQKEDLKVGLVYSWSLHIDENDFPTGKFNASEIETNIYPSLVCRNFLGNASCSLMRRSAIHNVGGYNPDFKQLNAQGCEDWDLYLKIAADYQFRVVRDFGVGYRKLKGSMSNNYDTMARSHLLLLDHIRNRDSQLPEFLYRFSKSNLSLYLARQSYLSNQYRTTLFWIKQAIKAEFMMAVIRPGLYLLITYSYWKIRNEKFDLEKSQLNNLTPKNSKHSLSQINYQPEINLKMRIKLRISLCIGNIFHQFITLRSYEK